jgi:hypothetical protein
MQVYGSKPAREQSVKRQSMNSQQATAITLRLMWIWLLIELVLNLPSTVLVLSSIEQYQQ